MLPGAGGLPAIYEFYFHITLTNFTHGSSDNFNAIIFFLHLH